ncbi:MAG: hypothetical protein M1835_000433 [Candelina submexicana]|nr:MAG: hypothetical protein M1835_000433 [Candelina submexicana]
MEIPIAVTDAEDARQHKRTTSSVLKSIMGPRTHRRNQSAGAGLTNAKSNADPYATGYEPTKALPMLPPNHPHAESVVLGELHHNPERAPAAPSKTTVACESRPQGSGKSLHKKTLSSVSLKVLAGKDKDKEAKKSSRSRKASAEKQLKKSKSQTSMSAILTRPRSSKGKMQNGEHRGMVEKENQTPPQLAGEVPPIWAQFSSQPSQEISRTATIPLNDYGDVSQEMALYTPKEYSPSKQRNFQDKPSLTRRPEAKPRPKSEYLPSKTSAAFAETLSGLRKTSDDYWKAPSHGAISTMQALNAEAQPKEVSDEKPKEALTTAKRGARVMAAVAAFNGKTKPAVSEAKVDAVSIDVSFEALLDARNVPQNMRQKLRSLDTHIKADFIRQDNVEARSAEAISSKTKPSVTAKELSTKRPTAGNRARTEDGVGGDGPLKANPTPASPTKRPRPRSKTFTLHKGDSSPSKRQRSDEQAVAGKDRLSENSDHGPSKSLTSPGNVQTLSRTVSLTVPEDFVIYLRRVQHPADVEINKLHKLRLLLRNETVAWVDSFITAGGMTEIVSLLNRVIAVEWREEHEDTLLHETLLCLKALCTTEVALWQLRDIQSSLFPALLAMLFDEEKKGPSEYTTRGIIMSLIFSYLVTGPKPEMASRANTILGYLRDPSPPEEAQPLGFIVSMQQTRPYRVWCKEIVNVTKEVFWIFLHHLNVVPIIQTPAVAETTSNFAAKHFPKERPPVPAAPYVGGVEWDATNYLAAHLDLMNGLIAALPTVEARNCLRQELRVSGFEKVMGGSLRTCKEKFYGAVHEGLKTWVCAAVDDGWGVRDVRMGLPTGEKRVQDSSPRKRKEEPPRIEGLKVELPALQLGDEKEGGEGWL